MPEPTSEIIRRALLDAMADPDGGDCGADEDDCFRRHPVHLGWSDGNGVQVVYVQVDKVGEVIAAALRAAGRLLPEGGQTRTEWGVRSPKEKDYLVDGFDPDEALFWARREVRILRDRDQEAALIRRSTHAWPDGTTFTGPWVAVDQPKED